MAEAKAKGELGKRGGFQPEKLFEPLSPFANLLFSVAPEISCPEVGRGKNGPFSDRAG